MDKGFNYVCMILILGFTFLSIFSFISGIQIMISFFLNAEYMLISNLIICELIGMFFVVFGFLGIMFLIDFYINLIKEFISSKNKEVIKND